MFKRISFLIIILLCFALVVSGCGGLGGNTDIDNDPPDTTDPVDNPGTGNKDPNYNAEGLYYEFHLSNTFDGILTEMVSKVYWYKDNVRIENFLNGSDETVVILNTEQNLAVVYFPDENKYIEDNPDSQWFTVKIPFNYHIDNPSLWKTLYTETYNGMECDVITYAQQQASDDFQTKIWVSKTQPFPVKIEVVDKDGSSTITEYKNIKTGALSMDLFQLPEGATEF